MTHLEPLSPRVAWTVDTWSETVDAKLTELPPDMRARLVRSSESIESSACGTSEDRTSATSAGKIVLALQRVEEVKP